MNYLKQIVSVIILLVIAGCFPTNLKLISDGTEPLMEHTVEGKGKEKVLIIPVTGVISDQPDKNTFRTRPGLVHEILAQLRKAEKDEDVKAVVLKVDSPGGTVTASDILYNEIKSFKEKKGVPVVVSVMNIGASGAYYISLPADAIYAHPTSIIGSVGVIFLRPKLQGLMEKIGVDVEVNKSGIKKDAGSPFRETTPEENDYYQGLTDELAERFVSLVTAHRNPGDESLSEIKTAAVFLPEKARQLGLIDAIGYLPDAIRKAETLAGIKGQSRVIAYRRDQYNDDTIYNNISAESGNVNMPDMGIRVIPKIDSGYHYLCPMLMPAGY